MIWAAGIVNTDQYKDMVTLRKDFGDFEIKVKTIKKTENKEEVKLFEKYVEVYNGQKGKYDTLKKLFLDK